MRKRQLADWTTCRPPTVFGVDQAVRGIWHAINWRLLHGVAVGHPAAAVANTATAPDMDAAAADISVQPPPNAAITPEAPAAVPAEMQAVAAVDTAPRHEVVAPAVGRVAAQQVPHVPSAAAAQQLPRLQWPGQDSLYAQLAHAQQQQQQQQQALAQAYQQQAYMQPPQSLADTQLMHDDQDGQQDDAPLGRGHRKKAPSSRINLALQGEQVP
jgi:hypothetical protein